MTKVLNEVPGAANNAHLLLEHVRNVENAVYFMRETEKVNSTINGEVTFRTCNYGEKPFRNSAYSKFGAWGWPFADTSCVTDYFSESGIGILNMTRTDASKYTIEDVNIALSKYTNTLKDNAKRLSAATGLNVSRAYSDANHEMEFSSHERCILQASAAVHFGDI